MKEAKDRWIEFEAVKRFEREHRGKLSHSEVRVWRDRYWETYWRLRHALTLLRSEHYAVKLIKDWRRMRAMFAPKRSRQLRRVA